MSNKQWHEAPLTKLQSLASTIAIMVAALFYLAGIERDVAVLEANQQTLESRVAEYQSDNKEMFHSINMKLEQVVTIFHEYNRNEDR